MFSVTIPEEKGSCLRFCQAMGPRVVTEFNYRYSDSAEASVFVSVRADEGPGALLKFLETLGAYWNITLFHYRSHGTDYGRVLVAFDASGDDTLGTVTIHNTEVERLKQEVPFLKEVLIEKDKRNDDLKYALLLIESKLPAIPEPAPVPARKSWQFWKK